MLRSGFTFFMNSFTYTSCKVRSIAFTNDIEVIDIDYFAFCFVCVNEEVGFFIFSTVFSYALGYSASCLAIRSRHSTSKIKSSMECKTVISPNFQKNAFFAFFSSLGYNSTFTYTLIDTSISIFQIIIE